MLVDLHSETRRQAHAVWHEDHRAQNFLRAEPSDPELKHLLAAIPDEGLQGDVAGP